MSQFRPASMQAGASRTDVLSSSARSLPRNEKQRQQPNQASSERREQQVEYHVYVRVPMARPAGFVDPPPVKWNEGKSEALWSVISGAKKADIDWDRLAVEFEVTVDYILRMAAYLTERHTKEIRAQMRRATTIKNGPGSADPSPVPPGSDSTALPPSEAVLRSTRAPSALSVRKLDVTGLGAGGSTPNTLISSFRTSTFPPPASPRPEVTRNVSSGTAVPTFGGGGLSFLRVGESRRRFASLVIGSSSAAGAVNNTKLLAGPAAEGAPSSAQPEAQQSESVANSASSESESSDSPVESRIIRRPPRFLSQPEQAKAKRAAGADGAGSMADGEGEDDDEDEDDDEPAFLPYQPRGGAETARQSQQDLGATLREDPRRHHHEQRKPHHYSQTSDSSTSSAAVVPRRTEPSKGFHAGSSMAAGKRPAGPLSPRRTAELSGRGKGYSRESSDPGTPSMGSSFSDLDDTSVTQSALEEALASKMKQDDTIGSRMSILGQALRSRYLPGSGGTGASRRS